MAERIVGIDFGTSSSSIRVRRYQNGEPLDDTPKAVTFDNGKTTVPTLVQKLSDMQSGYYGYEAEIAKPKATLFRNFKLNLESPDASQREEARKLTAEYLSYLGKIYRHQSETKFLGELNDTVKSYISYPVKWAEETRAFMVQAAADAGFPNVEGMDEAQACIQAVTEQFAPLLAEKGIFTTGRPCTILLIDMGAGTTDLVLCRHVPGDESRTDVLSTWPKGETSLFGGHEVDDLLQRYITNSFPGEKAVQNIQKSAYKTWKEKNVSPALLKDQAVGYFEALDQIEQLLTQYGMNINLHFEAIDRKKFEDVTKDYLPVFPKLVSGILADAGIDGGEVDLVILTGGHSQWYFVQEMLLGRLPQFGEIRLDKIRTEPQRILSLENPQETVAMGLVYRSVPLTTPTPETDWPKDADEQYALALNYANGINGTQDYKKAAVLYRMAAVQGHAQAQYVLGICYKNGRGVKADLEEAEKWLALAAQQGVELAATALYGMQMKTVKKTAMPSQAVTSPMQQKINPAPHVIVSPPRADDGPAPESEFQLINKGEGYEIVQYLGKRSRVIIPDTIRGRTVVSIGPCAFYPDFKKVSFLKYEPDTNLTYVEIPESIKEIGNWAFANCIKLEEVHMSAKIPAIGDGVFCYDTKLQYVCFDGKRNEPGIVFFPSTLKRIGTGAFSRGTIYNYDRAMQRKQTISKSMLKQTSTYLREVTLSKKTRVGQSSVFMTDEDMTALNFRGAAVFYYENINAGSDLNSD